MLSSDFFVYEIDEIQSYTTFLENRMGCAVRKRTRVCRERKRI